MDSFRHYLSFAPYAVAGIAALAFLGALLIGKARDPKESLANLGIWAINQVLGATVLGGSMIVALKVLSPYALFKIPTTWWSLALTFLVADLTYYWKHRMSHQIRLLWAFHSVHHSSREYNLTTALRLPWFGASLGALFYVPAVLLGFDAGTLFLANVLILLYQYGIHTEAIGRLGFLDAVFNTPSNHRVHHGSNAEYLDKNHAGVLVVWDRLFGTYQPEIEGVKVVYGLTKPYKTYNPVAINTLEMRHMLKDVVHARTVGDAWRYLAKGPSWSPGAR